MNENTFIPEIVVYKILKAGLITVKENFSQKPENETFLYRLYNGVSLEKNDLYEQAKDLFLRDDTHDRFVDIRMYFDSQRASIPTIHINLETEQEIESGLGIGSGNYMNLNNEKQQYYHNEDGSYNEINERRYDANYGLVCTSDNHNEVLIMYHYLRCVITSIHSALALSGFENLKTSGMQLQINENLVPEGIFSRNLPLSFSYINRVPVLFDKNGLCDSLKLNINYYIKDGR